jgi:hypothetical protein
MSAINAARRSTKTAEVQADEDIDVIATRLLDVEHWCREVRRALAQIDEVDARELEWLDSLSSNIDGRSASLCALPTSPEEM